ncbi:flagellar assembly protein FliH [Heyndrickxia acidicola]|uniref:Flagellar assembly protein FliH n=1 Tax=Heyndrickxia acidicola TaxID=209389 RepID=A0ABU6MBL8_9BACI|nr:flagellar assembly protein FliH [Heyndrickxia acidicola]MED1202075.1 flagellar assembly protein FliH [Heyndrickxia acidicola]
MSRIIKSQYGLQKKPARVIHVKNVLGGHEQDDYDEGIHKEEVVKRELLEKYKSEASLVISEAEEEAQIIRLQISKEREQWEEEKLQWIEQAKNMGYEEGLMLGRKHGQEEYKQILVQANQIVEQSKEEFVKKLEQSEKVVLDLGIKAAEKILLASLDQNEELYLSIVKQLVKEAKEFKAVQIHIHPSRYELIASYKKEIDALLLNNANCYIYANEDLSETQCILESNNGRIDASIDSQLIEMKKKLLELLEVEHHGNN